MCLIAKQLPTFIVKIITRCQDWWFMLVIPALERLR
jgi:hypothetical protein